jgi:hypothetical protein
MPKRTIPKAMFQPLEGLTAADLHENQILTDLVKAETYPAIEEAFNNKKTFATLFQINMTGHYIDIPKQYWVPALEECIKFNLAEEKFEDCVEIKNLIDKIKQPTKTVSKRKINGKGTIGNTTGDQPTT